MNSQRLQWLVSALTLCVLLSLGHVVQAIELGDKNVYTMENAIEVLRDPDGRLSIDDVRQNSESFQLATPFPALGYTRDVVWFRMPVSRNENASAKWVLKVSPSYLDHVSLWLEQDGRLVSQASIGRRDYGDAGYVLPDALQTLLTIPSGQSFLYLRVKTATTLAILPTFMSPDEFLRTGENNSFRIGFVAGVIGLVFLFNLVCWWMTGIGLYGLFAGYVSFGVLGILEGAGIISTFFWEEWQYLTSRPLSISLGFSWLFAYLFFLQLLVDKKKEWWLPPFYYLLFVGALAQVVAGVMGGMLTAMSPNGRRRWGLLSRLSRLFPPFG